MRWKDRQTGQSAEDCECQIQGLPRLRQEEGALMISGKNSGDVQEKEVKGTDRNQKMIGTVQLMNYFWNEDGGSENGKEERM